MMLAALVMACSTPELVRPSPTPTCLTALDEQYFDDLTGKVRSVGAITVSMGEDWIAAGYDPSLFLDDIWVTRQETNIYVLEQLANDILALRAPSSAASVQKIATHMATDMQTAMEFFERGLANLDSDALDQAGNLMVHVGDDARHIHGLIASFCQR